MGSWVVEGKELQHRNGGAGMRFYPTKIAKNGANQSSPLQHPPALPALSTSRPSSVTSATGSEETTVSAGNTHGMADFHPRRC